jgi:hypothetical protein
MALRNISPTPITTRPIRDLTIAGRTRAVLRLVPDLSVDNSASVDNRTFIGIITGIFVVGLLALLAINTSLTSGAFTMEKLKMQLASVNDQRDATLNQVANFSAPDQLALRAIKLGMSPQLTNNFVNLTVIKP